MSETKTFLIEAQGVSKSYRQGEERLQILKHVDLSLNAGETLAIMGRSGCGKSTLLSILAGLDRPDTGVVRVMGQDLAMLAGAQLHRFRAQNIGIIFQTFHLLDHLTAFENVRLPLDLERDPLADEKAHAELERVGLGHRRDHFADQMSRGECQRVAIARALVMKPKMMFADEPTGSLDAKTGQAVIDLIFSLVEKEKMSLVMVTHDPKVGERFQKRMDMVEGVLSAQVR